MGNNKRLPHLQVVKDEINSDDHVESVEVLKKDKGKVLFEYTNRRKVHISLADSNKTDDERRKENEEEFEHLCLRIEECSLSKIAVPRKSVRKSHSTCSSISSSRSIRPEVEEFHKFLKERGGHYGGWKEKDHLFFLKIRSKHPLVTTAEMVNESFPDISVDSVIAHDAWYRIYVKLRTASKKAIDEWRESQKVPPKEEREHKPEPKSQCAPVKRDPNVKQKIETWRARTEAAKQKRLEEHQQDELRKKREEEERRKKQEEKRALVNRYREEKLSYEMAMKAAEETEKLQAKREAVRQAALMLRYFRYEDRRFTERQKARKQQPVKEEPKRKSVEAKRDPSRLLQPTEGWIHHIKKQDQDVHSEPVYIQHLSRLGKPAWRKGLTS